MQARCAGALRVLSYAPCQHDFCTATGTIPLTGIAILRVEDGSGVPVQTFQQELGGLAPEGIAPFDATWDTACIERGPYRLDGYALYEGTSTSPAVLHLHTAPRIYLPLVSKGD